MIKCPECGTDARPGTRFCRNCGEMLPVDETLQMEAPRAPSMPVPPARPAPSVPPPSPGGELQATVPVQAMRNTSSSAPSFPATMPIQSVPMPTSPQPGNPQATLPIGAVQSPGYSQPTAVTPPLQATMPIGAAQPPGSQPTAVTPPLQATMPIGAVQPPLSPPQPQATPNLQATVAAPLPALPKSSYGPPSNQFAPPPQQVGSPSPQPLGMNPPGMGMPSAQPPFGAPGGAMPGAPPGMMPPGGSPGTHPKKSNVGLFVLIGGVCFVGLLLIGLVALAFLGTSSRGPSSSSSPGEKAPVTEKKTSPRGEIKIFEDYLTKVELSCSDSVPKTESDIKFEEDRKGTSFPTGIKALVLHLEGDPPSDSDLKAYWTKGGEAIQTHEIGTDLHKGNSLNLSIYKKDNSSVGSGSYQVEVKDKDGKVAARVKFFVGD